MRIQAYQFTDRDETIYTFQMNIDLIDTDEQQFKETVQTLNGECKRIDHKLQSDQDDGVWRPRCN